MIKKINFLNKLNLKILFYYVFFLCVHIGLVWLLPYFPTQDGPSHMYNLVILKDLLNGGKEWGDYFTYTLHAVPNLGFNLLAYPMLHLFPPLVVEKLFISIYIALMGIGTYFFLHTFNKRSIPFIFFVSPVIFNFNLLMGFYSYVITIPLFLFAFSISWKIRNSSIVCKFIFFNLAGLIIFYFHIIPFMFLLLSLICITFVQSKGLKRIIFDQLKLVVIISPSLIILFLYLADNANSFPKDFSYLSSFSRYIYLMDDLFFLSTVTFSPRQMFPGFILTCLFLSFFIFSVYILVKDPNGGWVKIKDISASYKVLICLSFFLILIYFVTPFRFGGGNFFNQRLPWVIFLILLPLLRINKKLYSEPFVLVSTSSVAIIFFVFTAGILWQQSYKVKKFLSGLNAGLPKGAYIMTYKTRDPKAGWPRADVLMHGASYYGIFNGCIDIGNYETAFDYFPIKFEDTIPQFPSLHQIEYKSDTINWSDYPFIQYVLGWEINKNDTEKLSNFFYVIYKNDPFSLWERNQRKSSATKTPTH